MLFVYKSPSVAGTNILTHFLCSRQPVVIFVQISKYSTVLKQNFKTVEVNKKRAALYHLMGTQVLTLMLSDRFEIEDD